MDRVSKESKNNPGIEFGVKSRQASTPYEDEMRKVIFAMSVSVDGFIETAGGDISWTSPDPELQSALSAKRDFQE